MSNKFIFGTIIFVFLIYIFMSPYSQILGDVTYSIDEDVLFLTFDDGPGESTEEILDILKGENIKATFFVVGDRINENPELLQRIANEGHSIGVHSMTHPYLYKNIESELKETGQLIYELTNQESRLFRPPYGFRTWDTIKTAEDLGLETITWSSFPMDYEKKSDDIVWFVTSSFHPGQIICLHDGPVNRKQTVLALPEIISAAKEQGYEFDKLE